MDTFTKVIVVINALVASLIFGVVCARGWGLYRTFNRREKVYHNALLFYTFAAAFSSMANYLHDGQDQTSPFVVLAANIYAARMFWSYHEEIFGTQ